MEVNQTELNLHYGKLYSFIRHSENIWLNSNQLQGNSLFAPFLFFKPDKDLMSFLSQSKWKAVYAPLTKIFEMQ